MTRDIAQKGLQPLTNHDVASSEKLSINVHLWKARSSLRYSLSTTADEMSVKSLIGHPDTLVAQPEITKLRMMTLCLGDDVVAYCHLGKRGPCGILLEALAEHVVLEDVHRLLSQQHMFE